MKTRVQNTSIFAFLGLKDLGPRQYQVYRAIERAGMISNLEIAYRLGLPVNSVTGRVFELREKGLVQECRREVSPLTGRQAIQWGVTL